MGYYADSSSSSSFIPKTLRNQREWSLAFRFRFAYHCSPCSAIFSRHSRRCRTRQSCKTGGCYTKLAAFGVASRNRLRYFTRKSDSSRRRSMIQLANIHRE